MSKNVDEKLLTTNVKYCKMYISYNSSEIISIFHMAVLPDFQK